MVLLFNSMNECLIYDIYNNFDKYIHISEKMRFLVYSVLAGTYIYGCISRFVSAIGLRWIVLYSTYLHIFAYGFFFIYFIFNS